MKDVIKKMPSMDNVAKSLQTKKVTLNLGSDAVLFFKSVAKKHGVSYQAIIRKVLEEFMRQYS